MAKNSACEDTGQILNRNKDRINLDEEERNILDKLKSLPPTNELLKYYQEALSKYLNQDEYLLQRLLALSQILDNSDRLRAELDNRDKFISELQEKYHHTQEELLNERRRKKDDNQNDRRKMGRFSERDNSRSRPYSSRTSSDEKSQVEHLQQEICRQEQVHREEMARERDIRHKMEIEMKHNLVNHHCRIEELEQTVCCLREEVENITRTCLKEREDHRRQESTWLQDRTKMARKLCYYEKFGKPEACDRIGQHTSDRVPSRVSEEKVLRSEVAKMKEEVKGKTDLITELRFELGQMAQDNLQMKKDMEQLNTCLEKTKDKTSKQIEILNQRNDKLEQRRRREMEGYEADIQRLRANIKNLENKITALTTSREQEKENAKILEHIRDELKKKSKTGNKKPEWVN